MENNKLVLEDGLYSRSELKVFDEFVESEAVKLSERFRDSEEVQGLLSSIGYQVLCFAKYCNSDFESVKNAAHDAILTAVSITEHYKQRKSSDVLKIIDSNYVKATSTSKAIGPDFTRLQPFSVDNLSLSWLVERFDGFKSNLARLPRVNELEEMLRKESFSWEKYDEYHGHVRAENPHVIRGDNFWIENQFDNIVAAYEGD